MYNTIKKPAVVLMLTFCLSLSGLPPQALASNPTRLQAQEPSSGTMVFDALLGRPILFATTLVGTAIFFASLPFSAAGGNIDQARKKLIEDPGEATFSRCLGCSAKDY